MQRKKKNTLGGQQTAAFAKAIGPKQTGCVVADGAVKMKMSSSGCVTTPPTQAPSEADVIGRRPPSHAWGLGRELGGTVGFLGPNYPTAQWLAWEERVGVTRLNSQSQISSVAATVHRFHNKQRRRLLSLHRQPADG